MYCNKCECSKCGKATRHQVYREMEGWKRGIIDFLTLGMAEFANTKWKICKECGHTEPFDCKKGIDC